MGKIRPVDVMFELPENKIIKFTIAKKHNRTLQDTNTEIGYASDLIFLSFYVSEIEKIEIPEIKYSKLENYDAWTKSIGTLKSSSFQWKKGVFENLTALPNILMDTGNIINAHLNNLIGYCDYIIEAENNETYEKYIEYFNKTCSKLTDSTNLYINNITSVKDILDKHSKRLKNESNEFLNLSKTGNELTKEQQQQIQNITNAIQELEDQRERYIAGAVTTGILSGLFIAGGIALIVLVPGAGIPLGITCFFGGGISATGMGICISESLKLKDEIESSSQKKSNIENEQTTIALLNTKFELLSKKAVALCQSVEEIWGNWKSILDVASNIKQIAQRLSDKKPETTKDIWQSVKNDLVQIQKLIKALEEPLATLDYQTQVFVDCDISKCETEEECLKKLKEYAEQEKKAAS